jgi:hypothetical protein
VGEGVHIKIYIIGINWLKKFTEKHVYVKLFIDMYLQLKFDLILIYNKAAMDN